MLWSWKTAVITFVGDQMLKYVYYREGELPCSLYKPTTHICRVCHQTGYRSNLSPTRTFVCPTSGTHSSTDGHECTLKCAACSEVYATGDR
ncbi:hypothetical protein HPB49_010782 [Dermacentor silvarum]|uniref:Uncharacterized protein n=1 Tax=Dermacentor silvarum TaxID=543639 RepID=A0ACB8CWW9_DERSI|nr:hypothetical protein HPB49_010782 [Dermacentor silvarum]